MIRALRTAGCAVALAALAGCTIGGEPATAPSYSRPVSATTPAQSAAPAASTPPAPKPSTSKPAPKPSATPGRYHVATWAEPIRVTGAPLFSVAKSGFRIDAYQAGTATSTKDSGWLDAKTKKDVWPKGKQIVYVIYVLTNVSSKPAYIGADGARAVVKVASLNYRGGVGGLVGFNTAQAATFGAKPTMMSEPPASKNSRPLLNAGASAATSQALPLQTNEPYTFTLGLSVYQAAVAPSSDAKRLTFADQTYTFK